jgi:surface antigen
MLFWEPNHTDDLKYGHVALVVEADADHVVVAQQNRMPPIQSHDTRELFNAINAFNSAYLGIKIAS